MTPLVRHGIIEAAKPSARPHVAASLDEFEKWMEFVEWIGVGQHYAAKVASLGGLGRALEKYEVMQ